MRSKATKEIDKIRMQRFSKIQNLLFDKEQCDVSEYEESYARIVQEHESQTKCDWEQSTAI